MRKRSDNKALSLKLRLKKTLLSLEEDALKELAEQVRKIDLNINTPATTPPEKVSFGLLETGVPCPHCSISGTGRSGMIVKKITRVYNTTNLGPFDIIGPDSKRQSSTNTRYYCDNKYCCTLFAELPEKPEFESGMDDND